MRSIIFGLMALLVAGFMVSCASHKEKINRVGKVDANTGIKFGDKTYEPVRFRQNDPAPGLTLVEGGTFMMGGGEKDIEMMMNNRQRQVTVQSFYMDITEVSNLNWKVFLASLDETGNADGLKLEELYPDTNVWRRDLAFNDPYAETYYQHPAFHMYPVVGVDWHQANEYCKWRTQTVNKRLMRESKDSSKFTKYPNYRLPTEAEWEYAARGLLESEVYSWAGKSLRNPKGKFLANFKRGRGDYAGWRGGDGHHMTDGYMITAPVEEFWPNDFGLYNMSGNVAEWTRDTYRLLSTEDVDDFNPFRSKGKTTIRPDDWLDDVQYKEKESLLFNDDNKAGIGTDFYDNVKVYRGGSWNDIAYYLSPGVRRFFPADSSSATIGFRCAMIRVGSPD